MVLSLELAMAPRFGLEVSPAMIAFSELLMLPYPAMQSIIEDELSANTALERLEVGECPLCRGSWRTRCPLCSVGDSRRSDGLRLAASGDGPATEPDTDALRRVVRLETAAADGPIVDHLIDSLDEHGFLDRSCAQLATELGVGESAVARVLAVLQRCGSAGIGASGVVECLLLQLAAVDPGEGPVELARAVVGGGHLPALAKGHFAAIARELGTSRGEVEQVLQLIRRRLRPYPAFEGNAPAPTRYVVPDVVIRERADLPGAFTVELVEPAMTRLGVRPARGTSGTGTSSVPNARLFLAQLRDRWETLRRVAECTVERQRDFLLEGATGLRPLTRSDVAVALELHESTVSRAIAEKYALLPDCTIVPLSRFFGVSGGVDGELRKLLEAADGPVSDQHLADRLRSAGYPIARRTVAKHRARLGFPPAGSH
jgi:RNA polymerase sigma-54 factor